MGPYRLRALYDDVMSTIWVTHTASASLLQTGAVSVSANGFESKFKLWLYFQVDYEIEFVYTFYCFFKRRMAQFQLAMS